MDEIFLVGRACVQLQIGSRQQSTTIVNYVNNPLSVPKVLNHSFQPFAKKLCVNPTSLSTFRMGSNVIWNRMLYLGWCARVVG